MAFGPAPATIEGVRDPDRIKRFTLARVGASPRSALGADRLERMEQIADAEREQQSRNGGDPQRRLDDQAAD